MDQNLILGLASPYRHEQGLQHDVRGLTALHCPANHPAGIEIDDDGKVGETLAGPEWSKKRRCASPPRTVRAPFSAYGSLFKLGPWP